MYKVGILHDFSEKEAFLVVVMRATAEFVYITHGIEARACTASGIDSLEAVPDPVAVLFSISIFL